MIAILRERVPRTWRQIAQVFGGMFVRNLLRGLFKLLLAGVLSPVVMGVLRATQSFWHILCTLSELGLNYTITVFVPPAIRRGDDAERDRTLMTVLTLLFGVIVVMSVGGLLLADRLAAWALGDASLVVYARLAVLAAAGRLIWKFTQSDLAARQQFGRLGLFLSTAPFLMIVSGVALALTGHLSLMAAVLITLLAPTATVLLWWPSLDRRFLRLANWDGALARRVLGFSRWIYLTEIGSSLRSHLNPLLLKSPKLSGSVQEGAASAGLYGFGNDMANELQMLSGAVVTVLMPKASRRTSLAELRGYVVRAYRGVLLLIVALAPLGLLAEPGLRILGRLSPRYLEYLPSVPIFLVLYGGGLLAIATIPVSTALHALRVPQIETRIEMLMVVVLIAGGFLMIPRYGPMGAAVTVLIQRILTLTITASYGYHRLWRRDDPPDAPLPAADPPPPVSEGA